MPRKAFLVQVELNVHAVTCPGVWLCPNGKISLQIHMLGSNIQTHCIEPIFPIVFDEKFVFSRSFYDVGKLGTLQKIFNKDTLYIELIQWQNCENGNVLATFQTTLGELLYPESKVPSLGNAEVDLLMEPMKNFPGILAPKIEVGTKTTIQDELCPANEESLETQVLCNPNLITSSNPQKSHSLAIKCGYDHQIARQKPVCHTKRCHITKCSRNAQCNPGSSDKKPPFVVRKVPDDLKYYCKCSDCNNERCEERSQLQMAAKVRKSRVIHTKNTSVRRVTRDASPERCCRRTMSVNRDTSPIRWSPRPVCDCGDQHSDNCVVCAKYKHYFENRSIKSQKRPENKQDMYECPCQQTEPVVADAVLCNYPPLQCRQPSMAQKLHARLSETLSQCGGNCQQVQQTFRE